MVAIAGAIAAGLSATAALGGLGLNAYNSMNAKDTSGYGQMLSMMNYIDAKRNQELDRANNVTQYSNQINNTLSQQDYNRRLNALMVERSRAGTSDDQGSQTYYDPTTNTWKSRLGPEPARVQRASDLASIERNTTDARMAQRVNQRAELAAIMARPGAEAARSELENIQPLSSDTLAGLLNTRTTQAANEVQRPALQDMMRQFARTGVNAAPVYAQMQRDNATNLNKSVSSNTIDAMTRTGDVNNARYAPAVAKLGSLGSGTTASLNFPSLSQQDPKNVLTNLIASRASNQPQTPVSNPMASNYPFNSASGTAAANQAAALAGSNPGNPNFGGQQMQSLGAQLKDFTSSLGSPSGLGGNINTLYNYFKTPSTPPGGSPSLDDTRQLNNNDVNRGMYY